MPGHSGLFTKQSFLKGDVLCDYPGELILASEAKKRAQNYGEDIDQTYMFFFHRKGDKERWLVFLDYTQKNAIHFFQY